MKPLTTDCTNPCQRNILDRSIKGLHLKQIVKSMRTGPSTPEPPCQSRAPAVQRWEGQVPPCSTLSEKRGSLGASVVWDKTHSCSRLLACFLSPPVCCSPAAQDLFPIYTARKDGWNHSQADEKFLNDCKSNTDTQMIIF